MLLRPWLIFEDFYFNSWSNFQGKIPKKPYTRDADGEMTVVFFPPQGILNLCCLFESLLWSKQPELFQHLKRINTNP